MPLPPPKEEEKKKSKPSEEDAAQTLDQQENMAISGTNARHMVMQKLMRNSEVYQKLSFNLSEQMHDKWSCRN